jgi:hypothetical protein
MQAPIRFRFPEVSGSRFTSIGFLFWDAWVPSHFQGEATGLGGGRLTGVRLQRAAGALDRALAGIDSWCRVAFATAVLMPFPAANISVRFGGKLFGWELPFGHVRKNHTEDEVEGAARAILDAKAAPRRRAVAQRQRDNDPGIRDRDVRSGYGQASLPPNAMGPSD